MAVTLEELEKTSGDPGAFGPQLDRHFKEFIEEGQGIVSTVAPSESGDDSDSISSTRSDQEAQRVRILTEGVRRSPTRACNNLPPSTYAYTFF